MNFSIPCPKWQQILNSQKQLEYFKNLSHKLESEYATNTIYPPYDDIFNALKICKFDEIKVVILGQDPYHGANQAHGLCFSVANNNPPPSLKNIFKAIKNDLGVSSNCLDGNLTPLGKQGVLLLNTILSVKQGEAMSHKDLGWQRLSDYFITQISKQLDGVVFLLWGSEAIKKQELIDATKHHILTSSHPSPLSAYRGFLDCKHFSKTNEILEAQNKKPIVW